MFFHKGDQTGIVDEARRETSVESLQLLAHVNRDHSLRKREPYHSADGLRRQKNLFDAAAPQERLELVVAQRDRSCCGRAA